MACLEAIAYRQGWITEKKNAGNSRTYDQKSVWPIFSGGGEGAE